MLARIVNNVSTASHFKSDGGVFVVPGRARALCRRPEGPPGAIAPTSLYGCRRHGRSRPPRRSDVEPHPARSEQHQPRPSPCTSAGTPRRRSGSWGLASTEPAWRAASGRVNWLFTNEGVVAGWWACGRLSARRCGGEGRGLPMMEVLTRPSGRPRHAERYLHGS